MRGGRVTNEQALLAGCQAYIPGAFIGLLSVLQGIFRPSSTHTSFLLLVNPTCQRFDSQPLNWPGLITSSLLSPNRNRLQFCFSPPADYSEKNHPTQQARPSLHLSHHPNLPCPTIRP